MPTPVMVLALLNYIFGGSPPDHVFDRTHQGTLTFAYICDIGQQRGVTLVNPGLFF